MKKFLILFLLLTACSSNFIIEPSPEKNVAGTIRCDSSGNWYVIDDVAHRPVNIDSVYSEGGFIIIKYSFVAETVNTFVAVPDETFSEMGFFIGASVDRDRARISISSFYGNEVMQVDPTTIRAVWGNIWIYGVFDL